MKKILIVATLFLSVAVHTKVMGVDAPDLPSNAKDFIATHFPGIAILLVETEGENFNADLANGFELEFDKDGKWIEIDGKRKTIPESIIDILPDGISKYLSRHYVGEEVLKVNIKRSSYVIETSKTHSQLVFDKKGRFKRVS